jgi:hypothetical protein
MELAGSRQAPCKQAVAALLSQIHERAHEPASFSADDVAQRVCAHLPHDVAAKREQTYALDQLHGVVLVAPPARPAAHGLVEPLEREMADYPALWVQAPEQDARASSALYEMVPREALSCSTGALLTEYGRNTSADSFYDVEALCSALQQANADDATGWAAAQHNAMHCSASDLAEAARDGQQQQQHRYAFSKDAVPATCICRDQEQRAVALLVQQHHVETDSAPCR